MQRVKYYSSTNWSYGPNFKIALETLNKTSENPQDIHVIDAIELYNIKKFFDDESSISFNLAEVQKHHYSSIVNKLMPHIYQAFNRITNETICGTINELPHNYIEDFLHLFSECKLQKKISTKTFSKILTLRKISLAMVLTYSKIATYYADTLKPYMLTHPEESIEVLFQCCTNQTYSVTFPADLSAEDINEILRLYLNDKEANLNYLRVFQNKKKIHNFKIEPSVRAALQRKSKELNDAFFEGKDFQGVKCHFEVSFTNETTKRVQIQTDTDSFQFVYSRPLLEENLENINVLHNFIYPFAFLDNCGRIAGVAKKHSDDQLYDLLTTRALSDYNNDISFNFDEGVQAAKLKLYFGFLLHNGIALEKVIEWYYMDYLPTEHSVCGFTLKINSTGTTYAEKCKGIFDAIENVFRLYYVFTKEGSIDIETVLETATPPFRDLPSLIPQKYIYPNSSKVNPEFYNVCYCLFSNQCMLAYIEGKPAESFYELLKKETVYQHDYEEYCIPKIDQLIAYDIIQVMDDGQISIKNQKKINLYRDIYYMNFSCISYCDQETKLLIDTLLEKGVLIAKSSLLADDEASFLNYYLNDSEFDNGPKLRNRYGHGLIHVIDDESVHLENYFLFLKLLIMVTLKINEEFCLRADNQKDFS